VDTPVDIDEFDPMHVEAVEIAAERAVEKNEDEHRAFLELRKNAYMRVFIGGTPTKEDRAIVLRDLGVFCRADETAFRQSERETTLVLGRQEVMHRIRYHTRFPVDTLMHLYPMRDRDGE
jgi:hypothetical protein